MSTSLLTDLRSRRAARIAAERAAALPEPGELREYRVCVVGGPRPADGFAIPSSEWPIFTADGHAAAVTRAIEAHRIMFRLEPGVPVLAPRTDDLGPVNR